MQNDEVSDKNGNSIPTTKPIIRIYMSRSFTDVASSESFLDMYKMALGYVIMLVYTSLMLGRFNVVEQRLYLTLCGILSVLMGIAISIGWTGIFGFPYTPVHAILPFLMVGIGIDNMFVIVQCWHNLNIKVSWNYSIY